MDDLTTPSRIKYTLDENGNTRRYGRLLNLSGSSTRDEDGNADFNEAWQSLHIAAYLGWKHVQERNGAVIPSLPHRLQGCDFDMTFDNRDTQFSRMQGIRELVAATSDEESFPFAMVGALMSSVSLQLSILAAAYEVPQVSGGSISSQLDSAPFFARTIPTQRAEARAAMLYYQSLGVTHMASVYQRDTWGDQWYANLQAEGFELGIEVMGFSFDPSNPEDIVATLENVKDSGMKYIFLIAFDWKPPIVAAYDVGVIGNPKYSWIATAVQEWKSGQLELSRDSVEDVNLAKALNGVGSLSSHVPDTYIPQLNAAMKGFAHNITLQQEYIDAHPDPSLFDNYTFPETEYLPMQAMFYDAAYGLGIAACETPGLFTGSELYQTFVNLQYEGVSGKTITFDQITGNRNPESAAYQIDNLYWSNELSNDNMIHMESQIAAVVEGDVSIMNPFRYNDNTTQPPLAVPPVEHDYNLIPGPVQVFGWTVAALVMLFSLGLMVWTWFNRKTFVVRASQPIFLGQLCVGTLVMASAVIPMGMQGKESTRGLDMACMATSWLQVLGFVIAFSALFSKTWRLNQLMNSGLEMRRIQVDAVDAIWPFVVLMTLNVAMLLGRTLVAPLRYVRLQNDSVDLFGRPTSSYGICKSEGTSHRYFVIALLLVNLAGVALATYQSYKARNLPTEFSESSYLAVAMASLAESLALGLPIYCIVLDDPTASYLVGSALLCVFCLTILVPVFVPKYINRRVTPNQVSLRSATGNAGTFVHSVGSRGVSGKEEGSNMAWGKTSIIRHSSLKRAGSRASLG